MSTIVAESAERKGCEEIFSTIRREKKLLYLISVAVAVPSLAGGVIVSIKEFGKGNPRFFQDIHDAINAPQASLIQEISEIDIPFGFYSDDVNSRLTSEEGNPFDWSPINQAEIKKIVNLDPSEERKVFPSSVSFATEENKENDPQPILSSGLIKSAQMKVEIGQGNWGSADQEQISDLAVQIMTFYEKHFGASAYEGRVTIMPKDQDPYAPQVFWDAYTYGDGRVFVDSNRTEDHYALIYSLACEIAHYWGYPNLEGFVDGYGYPFAQNADNGSNEKNEIFGGDFNLDEGLMAKAATNYIAGERPCVSGYCVKGTGIKIIERFPDFYLKIRKWIEVTGRSKMTQEKWLELAEKRNPGFLEWWQENNR